MHSPTAKRTIQAVRDTRICPNLTCAASTKGAVDVKLGQSFVLLAPPQAAAAKHSDWELKCPCTRYKSDDVTHDRWAEVAALNTSRCVDVRDWGARGDGITDDSDAIQAAVHAAIAGQKDFEIENTVTRVRQHNIVGGPDLCFSPGDYRVTRTIELSPDLGSPPNVRGLGKVNVRLNSSTVDIFSAISAFWWRFTGIAMVGGRIQLLVGNNNNDQGQIFIVRSPLCAPLSCGTAS